MTTVAFDGKTLAADSQAQTTFKSRIRKLYRLPDGALFGAAGAVQEMLAVLAWLNGGEKPADLVQFEALIVTRAGCDVLGMRLMREPVLEPFYAVGSGCHYALAAMACGKSATDAVRIASRFDPSTGGRVESMQLSRNTKKP